MIFIESLYFIQCIETYATQHKVIDMRQNILHYTLNVISKIALGSHLSKLSYVLLSFIPVPDVDVYMHIIYIYI